MEMNPSQQEAISFIDGTALCISGPGSGKTAVLTHRTVHLIDVGISPESILVITFTNAAALEMSQRFYLLCPDHPPVTFGTFHSVFFSILKEELRLKNDCILTGSKRLNILKEACENIQLDETIEDFFDSISREFSYIANSMTSITSYEPVSISKESFIAIHHNYCKIKESYGLLDFDDMLTNTYSLLSSNNSVLKKWQSKFKYFLIDEVQDMNELQFKTIALLASHTNNLFCVGDDDQSIYAFRGANPKIMLNFEKYYPDCKKIILNHNYRSSTSIVNKAIQLISHNENRFEKEIITTIDGGTLKAFLCDTEVTQASMLAQNILNAYSEGSTKYNEIAVLYRNNKDALPIIKEFVDKDIPFFIKDSMPNIYTHWIIEDIISYLMLSQSPNKIEKTKFLKIMNRPNRFISRTAVSKCEKYISFDIITNFYKDKPFMLERIITLQNSLNMISKMKPLAAINYIRKGIGYDDYLKEISYEKNADIRNFFEIIELLISAIHSCKSIPDAISLIFDLRKAIDYKNQQEKLEKDAGVGLFTLHSSKGLEYKDVHIINVNEGMIPSKKATTKEAIEEERRMFYVGITRAKSNLFLYHTKKYGTDKTYPSRFLSELNLTDS